MYISARALVFTLAAAGVPLQVLSRAIPQAERFVRTEVVCPGKFHNDQHIPSTILTRYRPSVLCHRPQFRMVAQCSHSGLDRLRCEISEGRTSGVRPCCGAR